MIGTILKWDEGETRTGRPYIRFTIETDGEISSGYLTPDAYYTSVIPLLHFCHLPRIWNFRNAKIIPRRFVGKLIPMKRETYLNRPFWGINYEQVRMMYYMNTKKEHRP
jgi:hypothetical protein